MKNVLWTIDSRFFFYNVYAFLQTSGNYAQK